MAAVACSLRAGAGLPRAMHRSRPASAYGSCRPTVCHCAPSPNPARSGTNQRGDPMPFDLAVYLPIVIILVAILATAIRILREYERGVVFTLGRFTGVKGPGLILLLPYVQ